MGTGNETQLRSPGRTTRVHAPAPELDQELDNPRSGLNREWVRSQAACPVCGADVGKHCKARRGDRERNHMERVRKAIRG